MPEWTAQELCAQCAAGATPRPEAFFEVVYELPHVRLLQREPRDLRMRCPGGHDITSQVAAIPIPRHAPQGVKPRQVRKTP
ncbi:MAG: hypothetical protein ACYDBQ_09055 [Thermoplasmatota archaeon]